VLTEARRMFLNRILPWRLSAKRGVGRRQLSNTLLEQRIDGMQFPLFCVRIARLYAYMQPDSVAVPQQKILTIHFERCVII